MRSIRCVGRVLSAFALLGLHLATPSRADEIRPSLLDIKEQNTGLYAVTWKVPVRGDRALGITPVLPDNLEQVGSSTVEVRSGSRIERSMYKSNSEPLAGQSITIERLTASAADVLLLIQLQDGTQHSAILRAAEPTFVIPEQASKLQIARDYWRMGTVHILEGVDHLLFVLALMLIVNGFGSLLKAVTAFTAAHSLTLALATLGFVHLPSAPTEAIIALSIVFLATEVLHKQGGGPAGLTERYPWIVAFGFGLFHGLGFAGALSEIGVPQHEVPLALLIFNVGVESGQLLFIAAVLTVMEVLRRLPLPALPGGSRLLPYGIGSVAAFWTIQRVASFL